MKNLAPVDLEDEEEVVMRTPSRRRSSILKKNKKTAPVKVSTLVVDNYEEVPLHCDDYEKEPLKSVSSSCGSLIRLILLVQTFLNISSKLLVEFCHI